VVILPPTSGSIAPAESATVHLQAMGGDSTGTFPATLLISSNDPERSIMTTLAFPLSVQVVDPTSSPQVQSLPLEAALHSGMPNPFRTSTAISFDLPRPGPVRLGVFDIEGRLVRKLADGNEPAGQRTVVWDGRDDEGRLASSGVFFVKLEASGRVLIRKSIHLR
jgi:hypothetical protein